MAIMVMGGPELWGRAIAAFSRPGVMNGGSG